MLPSDSCSKRSPGLSSRAILPLLVPGAAVGPGWLPFGLYLAQVSRRLALLEPFAAPFSAETLAQSGFWKMLDQAAGTFKWNASHAASRRLRSPMYVNGNISAPG